jgi:plasmid stabilization system protein ParE
MNSYKLTPAAQQDLAEIFDFIALDNPQNALKVFDEFHAGARRLYSVSFLRNSLYSRTTCE